MTRTLLFFLAAIAFPASTADRAPRLSLCDLIARRSEYNGRMVAVRGRVAAGGHGPYLVAPGACSYELVTRGVVWPNIINVVFPDNRSPDVSAHAPFTLDRGALQALDDYFRNAHYQDGLDVAVATYVGYFVTYPDLDKRVSPGVPGALRLGFGPAGMGAPAQLVIKSIKDVPANRGNAPR